MKNLFFVLCFMLLAFCARAQLEGGVIGLATQVSVTDNTAPSYTLRCNFLSYQDYGAAAIDTGDVYLMEYADVTPTQVIPFRITEVTIIVGNQVELDLERIGDQSAVFVNSTTGLIVKGDTNALYSVDANIGGSMKASIANHNAAVTSRLLHEALNNGGGGGGGFSGSWDDLTDVPPDFADGIDNIAGGGGVDGVLSGLTLIDDTLRATRTEGLATLDVLFTGWDTNSSDDFSGDYNDLTNQPVLFDGDYNSLSNLPTLFDGAWGSLTGVPPNLDVDATDDFDGDYNSLANLPVLFSGAWADLTGVPANLDVDATDDFDGAWSSLTGVPANIDLDVTDDFDGNYNSLSNLPTLFSGAWNDLTGVPANLDLDATDDFSGNYNDLSNLPSLFDGDYNSLTNKPTLVVNFNDLGDVNAPAPSVGQIPKWNGTAWTAQDDNVSGGAGTDGVVTGMSVTGNTLTATRSNSLPNLTATFTNWDIDNTDDFSGAWADLTGVPANIDLDATDDFDGNYNSLSNLPSLFDGAWSSLTGVPPNLDTDATDDFDGAWGSLTGVPANIDLDATDDFSGNYNDLANLPSLFDGAWSSLSGVPAGFADDVDNIGVGMRLEPTLTQYDVAIILFDEDDWTETWFAGSGEMRLVLDRSGDWSGTFDGQQGSYYLNYNNLTNTPALFDGTWASLTGKPAGFADDVDNVEDADASAQNEGSLTVSDEGANLVAINSNTFASTPVSILGTNGVLVTRSVNQITLDGSNFLTSYTETDPVWLAEKAAYATIANLQNDGTSNVHWNNLTDLPPNLDTDATDDFDGAWGSLTGVPADIADGDDNDNNYATGILMSDGNNDDVWDLSIPRQGLVAVQTTVDLSKYLDADGWGSDVLQVRKGNSGTTQSMSASERLELYVDSDASLLFEWDEALNTAGGVGIRFKSIDHGQDVLFYWDESQNRMEPLGFSADFTISGDELQLVGGGSVAWASITGIPAGFDDDIDDNTFVNAIAFSTTFDGRLGFNRSGAAEINVDLISSDGGNALTVGADDALFVAQVSDTRINVIADGAAGANASNLTFSNTDFDNIGSALSPSMRLADQGITEQQYGDATMVPRVTVNDRGVVTAIDEVAIAAGTDDQNLEATSWNAGVLTIPIEGGNSTTASFVGWDDNASDDFDGAWGSLSGVPSGFSDNQDNTVTMTINGGGQVANVSRIDMNLSDFSVTNSSGVISVDMLKTGDWTGTFDGQEGSYYLAYGNLTGAPTFANGIQNDAGTVELGSDNASAVGITNNRFLNFNTSTSLLVNTIATASGTYTPLRVQAIGDGGDVTDVRIQLQGSELGNNDGAYLELQPHATVPKLVFGLDDAAGRYVFENALTEFGEGSFEIMLRDATGNVYGADLHEYVTALTYSSSSGSNETWNLQNRHAGHFEWDLTSTTGNVDFTVTNPINRSGYTGYYTVRLFNAPAARDVTFNGLTFYNKDGTAMSAVSVDATTDAYIVFSVNGSANSFAYTGEN